MKAKTWKERYIRFLVLKGFTIKKATDFFNSVEDIDFAYPHPEDVARADFEVYCEEESKKYSLYENWWPHT